MTPNPSVSTKTPSKKQMIHQFIETLNVKHNNTVQRFGLSKVKHKAIKKFNVLWSHIVKRHIHEKINHKVRESLYHWIIHHLQFV